jgi:hypothetical protein
VDKEAEIVIDGTRLTENEAAVVRVALAALRSVLADGLGFRDDGIALTDRYQADAAYVHALLTKSRRT